METCGMQLAKYMVFGFNLIFVVSGLIVVIIGGVVLANVNNYSEFMESRVLGPPIVLIIVGLIIFFIAFLGCWGAFRENSNMLVAYAVLLLIIFITEIAVGITAAVVKDDFQDTLKTEMKKSTERYTKDSGIKKTWDSIQMNLECCGVNSNEDWTGKVGSAMVTSSCCKNKNNCDNTTRSGTYNKGCYDELRKVVKDGALILAGVGMGIAFIELAGIVLALLLVHSIKKSADEK